MACKVLSQGLLIILFCAYICQAASIGQDELQINSLAQEGNVRTLPTEQINIGDFANSLTSASATAGSTASSTNGAPSFSGSTAFSYSVNFPNIKTFADLNKNPLKIITASSQSTAAAIGDSFATSDSHAFVRTTPDFKSKKTQILSADAIANALAKDNSVAKAKSESISFDSEISDLLNQLGDTKPH